MITGFVVFIMCLKAFISTGEALGLVAAAIGSVAISYAVYSK